MANGYFRGTGVKRKTLDDGVQFEKESVVVLYYPNFGSGRSTDVFRAPVLGKIAGKLWRLAVVITLIWGIVA